jgi:hypothetical protein
MVFIMQQHKTRQDENSSAANIRLLLEVLLICDENPEITNGKGIQEKGEGWR